MSGLLSAPAWVGLFPLTPTHRGVTGARKEGYPQSLSPNVENDICVITRDGRYFQSVAMPNAAAINPMPIRMFQFPRSLISGMVGPAT